MRRHDFGSLFFLSQCLFLCLSLNAQVRLTEPFQPFSVQNPVDIQNAGDDRLFFVSQRGVIEFLRPTQPSVRRTFLDISSRVTFTGECGLLGLAFHPRFQENGFFYLFSTRGNASQPLSQTNPLRMVISRVQVSPTNPDSADIDSEVIVFETPKNQSNNNHNGGVICFGPDSLLYFSIGDGGGSFDPMQNSQNLSNYHGKIMRINVDVADSGRHYSIPVDNPFFGHPIHRNEIYAYGLRNVWKMSFDPANGRLWAADVGQNMREEVNWIEKGGNYGWRRFEGRLTRFQNDPVIANPIFPVHEYPHDAQGNISITGGVVYRGARIPELFGSYVFGDFASGRIWRLDGSHPDSLAATFLFFLGQGFALTTFGVDIEGEIYVANYNSGRIFRIERTVPLRVGDESKVRGMRFSLDQNYPNPFNPSTVIPYSLSERSVVSLRIYDLLGREVAALVNGIKDIGQHRAVWNARGVGSGVYVYELRVGEARQIRKMVLMK